MCGVLGIGAFVLQIAGGGAAFAADVSYYGVVKSIQYEQTNAPSPALLASNAFTFHAFAVPSTNGVLTNATVKASSSPVVHTLVPDAQGFSWRYEESFQTQAAMDSAYPQGSVFSPVNYTTTLYCTNDGVRSGAVNFFLVILAVSYPPVPELTNLVAGQSIDTTRDFALGWKSLGGSALSLVELTVLDAASNVVYASALPFTAGALDGASLGAVIPANTLPAGSTLVGHLSVGNPGLPNTNSYAGATGVAALARDTEFRLTTRPSPTPPRLELRAPYGAPWRLQVTGEADRLYQVDASTDLAAWTNLAGIYTATGSFEYTDETSPGQPRRYYRARVGQ